MSDNISNQADISVKGNEGEIQLSDGSGDLKSISNVFVTNDGVIYATAFRGDGGLLSNISGGSGVTPTLQQVTDKGNTTSNTVQFTNATTSLVTSGNVGISNTNPTFTLSVGSNTYVSDTGSNTIVTTGNISANYYLGNGGLLSNISRTLQQVTDAGNTTSNTVQFTNAGTSLTTSGNVSIGSATSFAGFKLNVEGTTGTGIRLSDTTNDASLRTTFANGTATIEAAKSGAVSTAIDFKTQTSAGSTATTMSLNAGNVGIGTNVPANLLSAYSRGSSSTITPLKFASTVAVNGTGGGNRGFDTSFTSTVTSFTGTDNADQGYGYFLLTITNGFKYTLHFYSNAVNGILGTIITSSGTNFATNLIQTITIPAITNDAYTSVTFTATGSASYIGFAGFRTSGTLSLTISELSVFAGNPDIETGSLVAYKNLNVIGSGGDGISNTTTCTIADNFTNSSGIFGTLLKLDAGSQYNRLMKFGCNSTGNIIQGSQSADENAYRDIFLQPSGAAIIIGAGTGAGTTESLLNTYINSNVGGSLTSLAEFRNVDYTSGVRSFIRVRQGVSLGSSVSSYFGTGQDNKCYIIANNSARGGDIVIDGGNGRVGIGKASPSYLLDVAGTGGFAGLVEIINYTTGHSLFVGGTPTNGVSNGIVLLQSGRVPQSGSDTTGLNGLLFQHTISAATTVNGGYIYNGREKVFSSSSEVDTYLSFATTVANTNNERMRITSTGDVLIGSNVDQGNWKAQVTGNMFIRGSDSTSSNSGLYMDNSTGNPTFLVRNDGLVGFPKINDFTTGNAPNAWINPASSYGIYISTSSIRYKKDIRDYDKGLDIVKKLTPVYYKSKSSVVDGDKQFAGFIAEDIHHLGLTEFVNYLEDGTTPNSLAYQNMVVLLTKAIQEQQVLIDALTTRIANLEAVKV